MRPAGSMLVSPDLAHDFFLIWYIKQGNAVHTSGWGLIVAFALWCYCANIVLKAKT
jgi:hypothetical protein